MVERLENGKIKCNETILESSDAYEIMKFLEHEFHVEDIINTLEEDYPELDTDKNEELVEEITRLYEKNLSNDDSWHYCANLAVKDREKEIEAASEEKSDVDSRGL